MTKKSKQNIISITSERITSLFARPVSVCIATPEMFVAPLWQKEMESIAHAIQKRRREFTAGRTAARCALLALGAKPGPIFVNSDRSPAWPSGFVGSISHCDGFCGAVVGRNRDVAGLGFDAELASPLSKEIAQLVYDGQEAAHFEQLPSLTKSDWGKLAFSAKEAFYKCYYPHTKTFIDFHDISIFFSIDPSHDCGDFFVEMKEEAKRVKDHTFIGRWLLMEEMAFTGAVLTPEL